MRQLQKLIRQGGMGAQDNIRQWFDEGAIQVNGVVASAATEVAVDDDILIDGKYHYRVARIPQTWRWYLQARSEQPQKITGAIRVHCGQHKCLTMYVRNIMGLLAKSRFIEGFTFRHFFGRLDEFYRYADRYSLSSVSGHPLELDRFDDIKVTRFIRDPRDLVVSSYFYHKRNAENWCGFKNPVLQDYARVNGAVPAGIPAGGSLTSYLNSCSLQEGLKAEIEFRQYHFESMLQWPEDDKRVKTFRYEHIMGNEAEVFSDMCRHFGFPSTTQYLAAYNAHKLRAAKREKQNTHIRNAKAGQWREYFSPQLTERFKQQYGELLERLAYPLD